MTTWMCLEARFLFESYHGLGAFNQAEWPPSPDRLFQALIASAHPVLKGNPLPPEQQKALQWLETLGAPEIRTPDCWEGSEYITYVILNDTDNKGGREKRAKLIKPQFIEGDATVRYLWPIPSDSSSRALAGVLIKLSQQLHHLGRGVDFVVGNGKVLDSNEVKEVISGIVWEPREGTTSRVPVAGTLAELDKMFAVSYNQSMKGLPPHPGLHSKFTTVSYFKRGEKSSVFSRVFSFRDLEGEFVEFGALDAARVGGMLRHAAGETAKGLGWNPKIASSFVFGHNTERDTRISYTPIPSVHGKYADGSIRRALLRGPAGSGYPGEHRDLCVQLMKAMVGKELINEETRKPCAILQEVNTEDSVSSGFTGKSKVWESATPVVLDGCDGRSEAKAEKLVFKCLERAGIKGSISRMWTQQAPFFPKAFSAKDYFVAEHLRNRTRVHVHIEFTEPMRGPLALGGGRHSGLGVFAAV